ncbi:MULTISPECIES: hypothetical protein [unclassified Streptomyces]|uniref:hypothetical protein n=1 Tax=unclassified Streptomyces TaxID=2593676 RepID=UPI002E2914DA|nr:hypothetical protein [Streptomyces sp. NBC_00273]
MQIVDALLRPDAPQSPAPQGLTHIQLLLKVTGAPGRPIKKPRTPRLTRVVQYDGCKAAQRTETKISCSSMADGGEYFTAEQMRAQDYSTGVYKQIGDVKADTPYWIGAWQPVPEKAGLSWGPAVPGSAQRGPGRPHSARGRTP